MSSVSSSSDDDGNETVIRAVATCGRPRRDIRRLAEKLLLREAEETDDLLAAQRAVFARREPLGALNVVAGLQRNLLIDIARHVLAASEQEAALVLQYRLRQKLSLARAYVSARGGSVRRESSGGRDVDNPESSPMRRECLTPEHKARRVDDSHAKTIRGALIVRKTDLVLQKSHVRILLQRYLVWVDDQRIELRDEARRIFGNAVRDRSETLHIYSIPTLHHPLFQSNPIRSDPIQLDLIVTKPSLAWPSPALT